MPRFLSLLLLLPWLLTVPGTAEQTATPAADRLAAWDAHVALEAASPFARLPWRAVGPKQAGARVEAIAVPPGRGGTIYVGVGSGNIWKTKNGGVTWTPIFEHESTFTIGDIAVSASNPDVVWVGTGETQPRHSGYSYAGTGVFRSTDAGRTWQNMGLHDTHHIGKVVIDPKNPDVVYVAAIGHFWSTNAERGVFKTSDGGRTWEKALFVSERTGAVDLVMDPSDSRILYAAAWQLVGGPESGIYKTTDAGRTWAKLAGGLPGSPLGRMGLDIAPSNPRVVYAFIDNQAPLAGERPYAGGEVYRSDDKGRSWRKANEDDLYPVFGIYGWKFTDVRVSPADPDDLFILGNRAFRSTDGGRTFSQIGETIVRVQETAGKVMHLDHHEIWIDPLDPAHVLLGNDGGLYESHDTGRSWLHLNNIPAAEFYAVSVDMRTPYWIYGGTQDNAALYGPSDVALADASIDPWENVYLDRWTGGDSFTTLVDPTDDRVVYYEHQNGAMRRMYLDGPSVQSGGPATTNIAPRAPEGEAPWRFGWYTPFVISHHAPRTLYAGGNYLLRSLDRGDHWFPVSGDLSDPPQGERGAVPYGTITSIAESPLDPNGIWVGTEGGSVWVGTPGQGWSKSRAGLPLKWVSRVIASRHDRRTAYVSLTGFREDDFRAYLYRTTDFGATWTSIAGNLPQESINVVREDPVARDVLYVGTDLGVYASLDRGRTWVSLCAGLPTTPVHDLVIHPRDGEMVVGTHGRSAFVLDVRPIQQWPTATEVLHLFDVRPVFLRYRDDLEPSRSQGEATILYSLARAGTATVTVRTRDRVARRLEQAGEAGLNTLVWDLQVDDEDAPGLTRIADAGTYWIEVTANDRRAQTTVQIFPVPQDRR